MLCPMKVNSNTIELTAHTSCYCILDLLCVTILVSPCVIIYRTPSPTPGTAFAFIKNNEIQSSPFKRDLIYINPPTKSSAVKNLHFVSFATRAGPPGTAQDNPRAC